ncbi:MOSC domain-containing protein [Candidatus Zixiibacteriota bacterium]
MGTIEALSISSARGMVKEPVGSASFIAGYGIEGDAHAGEWHRQVSLLPGESIDRMKESMPDIDQGAFAENIITRGLDLSPLDIGDTIIINDAVVLEITQIGKECHSACAIQEATGECIMPTEGVFCRVIEGGIVKLGNPVSSNQGTQSTY